MKRNFYCQQNQKGCEYCNRIGNLTVDVENEKEEIFCPNNGNIKLKLMGKPVLGMVSPKMTLGQIEKDRKIRSSNDFKKNILPKFEQGSTEHQHFSKKNSNS